MRIVKRDLEISLFFFENIGCSNYLECVGKNNRYGHPKDEVLDTLKNSKIYRTDVDVYLA